jgi:hypothetical protein
LGDVQWLRDLDEGCRVAGQTGKPLLVLFQEIPGCQTCQTFGAQPLSHPLLVEAMEDLFVPVAIYNNKPGADEVVLKQFDEPAWNNPVIRYLNSNKQDIVPRKDRLWTVGETARRMVEALTTADQPVPEYLRLVVEESSDSEERAIFSMHCFWEGEGQLGGLPGVQNTVSAWLGDKEVVEVIYDPTSTDRASLAAAAKKLKCAAASEELTSNDQLKAAKTSDQKYYLRQSLLKHLPLTLLQATRVNAALHKRRDPSPFLSPRQRSMLMQIEALHARQPDRLADMIFPDDAGALPEYQKRLAELLPQS